MIVEREVTALQALRELERELAARRKGWQQIGQLRRLCRGLLCTKHTGRNRGVFSLDKLRTARREKKK